ncbi:MAG: hypothetical protein LBH56_04875, partial [Coriobacteriales bacterium]|nr:hypothetical protein [Coriobacteriales bacterium]
MSNGMAAMRKHIVRVMAFLLAAFLLLGVGALAACSNAGENEGGQGAQSDAVLYKVTVIVDINAAIEEDDATALELKESMGASKSFEVDVPADSTVLEALRATKLPIVTEKASFGEYVISI